MPTLTPSKRHMNWVSTQFVTAATTPVTIPITSVQSIDLDQQVSLKKLSGDGDQFNTTIVRDFGDPQATVHYNDLASAHQLIGGLRGTFSSTHNDSKNLSAVGGGGYTVSLGTGGYAVISNTTSGGKHRDFGEAQTMICAESADGLTNPMTFTAL